MRRNLKKTRAKGSSANACDVRQATHKDHVWCWDFAFDRTENGTTLKWLSIIDEHTRECLALKGSRSITSEDVIDTLAELFAIRPEFVSKAIQARLKRLEIGALYIAPGTPWENGYAESFH